MCHEQKQFEGSLHLKFIDIGLMKAKLICPFHYHLPYPFHLPVSLPYPFHLPICSFTHFITIYHTHFITIYPFHSTGLFRHSLKTLENLWFSDVFRGYRKASGMKLVNNFLIHHSHATNLVGFSTSIE